MQISPATTATLPPTAAGLRGHAAARNAIDLSLPGRGGMVEQVAAMDPAERGGFLEQLATLLRAGVVGMETYNRDGRAVERFTEIAMADDRLRGATPARPGEVRPRGIDLRA